MLLMRREDYFHYLKAFDGAAIALLRDLMMRMRTMQRRMEDLGGGGVEFRLGRVLQTFCATSKGDGPLYIPVPLTRQDFADMVGARVETVIRIMSRWQKEGLIGTDDLWVDEIPEVGPFMLALRLPERPRSVTWAPQGRRLSATWGRGELKLI